MNGWAACCSERAALSAAADAAFSYQNCDYSYEEAMQKCTTFTYTQQVAPQDYALKYAPSLPPFGCQCCSAVA